MPVLTDSELRVLREKVEVMTGERGDRQRRALRASELQTIEEYVAALRTTTAKLTAQVAALSAASSTIQANVTAVEVPFMTAETIGMAPTAADYNKVVADLGALQMTLAMLRSGILV